MTTLIEFGSRRHGCYDIFSDKDIYLLCSSLSNIAHEKDRLINQGYSVTVSTQSRAEYLASKGSLFIRHVFYEGIVIGGSSEKASAIKNRWVSSPSYEKEIEENTELLSVLESIPSTKESLAVVNDIIVCSIRNVLIRKLANIGIFVFSWKDVLSHSNMHNFIANQDVKIIYRARRYKNMYRSGIYPLIETSFLCAIEDLLRRVIDRDRKVKFGSHREILAAPEKLIEGSYSQLRAIELLCSHYQFHKSMKKYSMLAKDPAYFSAVGPNRALQRTSR